MTHLEIYRDASGWLVALVRLTTLPGLSGAGLYYWQPPDNERSDDLLDLIRTEYPQFRVYPRIPRCVDCGARAVGEITVEAETGVTLDGYRERRAETMSQCAACGSFQ